MPPFRRPLRTSVVPARVCLVALLIAAGCGAVGQRSVAKVPLDQASPPALSESADTRSVLASVAWVIVNRLGLPLSSPLHAYFYASQEAFEPALVGGQVGGIHEWGGLPLLRERLVVEVERPPLEEDAVDRRESVANIKPILRRGGAEHSGR